MSTAALRSPKKSTAASLPRKRRRRKSINDLDLKRWKDYDDILTDSLWIINERDGTGKHTAGYHGNFVPQIPRQAMMRYTCEGDCVLDTFLGSGTTLIEAQRLGRNGIGLELQPEVAEQAQARIDGEENARGAQQQIFRVDSTSEEANKSVGLALEKLGKTQLQMIVSHPPYHDIIKFSDNPRDLSNAMGTEGFCEMFSEIVGNFTPFLEKGRYFVLVIGDKYENGEWIPLGFQTMQTVLEHGYTLKSLIVKNMAGNRAKRNLQNLWRYRALYGGFYIFRHEYVMFFKKK